MQKGLISILLVFLFAFSAHGEGETKGAGGYAYYGFEPDIITNYVKPGKKVGYVRVVVELMLENANDLETVEHHDPLLRDAIIKILGKQDEQRIKSLTGRDDIRKECLREVNKLLVQEAGRKAVADLLFTKYLYQ